MTAFVCDHGDSYALFGSGGGQRLAAELGVPLPRLGADRAGGGPGRRRGPPGRPVRGRGGRGFKAIAERLVTEVLPPVELTGCTARMLDNIEKALAQPSAG